MNEHIGPRDLFVLAADLELANALEGLLSRPTCLNIKEIYFDIERHPNRDSGCRIDAVEYLRPYMGRYRHALVAFDRWGCGSSLRREEIQHSVEEELRLNGWDHRAKAIVIDPELEVWIWSESAAVSRVLGWGVQYRELRRWLNSQGLWPADRSKPSAPKKAMGEAMKQSRSRRSARKFLELATTVDFSGCEDPAFNELRETLGVWFPPGVGP